MDCESQSMPACAQIHPQAPRAYRLRVAWKDVFAPGAIRNVLTHLWLLPLRRAYHAQAAQRGQSCVIEVIPEQAELLNDEIPG